jgi:predicted nucleic acid-binding protein
VKYKRVFLDANVILDLYDQNRPFYKESAKAIYALLQDINIDIFTSCDIITTLYYVLSKKDKTKALDYILDLNDICSIVEFGNDEVLKSCRLMRQNKKFIDLEDTIQYVMAKKVDASLILTNDKSFVSDGIDVLCSDEFCKEFRL